MTSLVWDQVEDRQYETGIERGVLYPIGFYAAVAWNGLVSVAESPARESKVYYQDGVKLLERLLAPSYSAKIQAFTYPDVLDEMMGNRRLAPGVHLHEQREGKFHLSYRTRIGSALDGVDHGYKLHLVYNLVINPSDTTFETLSNDIKPNVFEWTISATPFMWGGLAVNHISLDSRTVDPVRLAEIESGLYGTPDTSPGMIDPIPLLESF